MCWSPFTNGLRLDDQDSYRSESNGISSVQNQKGELPQPPDYWFSQNQKGHKTKSIHLTLQNPEWPKSNEISEKKNYKGYKAKSIHLTLPYPKQPNPNFGHLGEGMYRQPSLFDNHNNQQKIIKIEEVQLWICYLYQNRKLYKTKCIVFICYFFNNATDFLQLLKMQGFYFTIHR